MLSKWIACTLIFVLTIGTVAASQVIYAQPARLADNDIPKFSKWQSWEKKVLVVIVVSLLAGLVNGNKKEAPQKIQLGSEPKELTFCQFSANKQLNYSPLIRVAYHW